MERRSVVMGLTALAMGCRGADEARSEESKQSARADLYQCEGCEGALEHRSQSLAHSTPVGPGLDRGEALRLEGVIYQVGGQSPAPGVVLYAYHTNAAGLYADGTPETEASRRHGRLRGWIKTGADGRYVFDTIKPEPYPDDTLAAHVHLTVLEPGRRPYWIDNIVFDGEFGVDQHYRKRAENRGGSGIVRLQRESGLLVARRDIVLERHP